MESTYTQPEPLKGMFELAKKSILSWKEGPYTLFRIKKDGVKFCVLTPIQKDELRRLLWKKTNEYFKNMYGE